MRSKNFVESIAVTWVWGTQLAWHDLSKDNSNNKVNYHVMKNYVY